MIGSENPAQRVDASRIAFTTPYSSSGLVRYPARAGSTRTLKVDWPIGRSYLKTALLRNPGEGSGS